MGTVRENGVGKVIGEEGKGIRMDGKGRGGREWRDEKGMEERMTLFYNPTIKAPKSSNMAPALMRCIVSVLQSSESYETRRPCLLYTSDAADE